MKTCSKCGEKKEASEFNKSSRNKDGLHSYCRLCSKGHYKSNSVRHRQNAKARREQYRAQTLALLLEFLLTHPCVSCGESDPVVLQFDHRDPSEKLFSISEGIRNERPWSVISLEIEKCDVRCCNCHARRTAEQFGWWKHIASVSPRVSTPLEG